MSNYTAYGGARVSPRSLSLSLSLSLCTVHISTASRRWRVDSTTARQCRLKKVRRWWGNQIFGTIASEESFSLCRVETGSRRTIAAARSLPTTAATGRRRPTPQSRRASLVGESSGEEKANPSRQMSERRSQMVRPGEIRPLFKDSRDNLHLSAPAPTRINCATRGRRRVLQLLLSIIIARHLHLAEDLANFPNHVDGVELSHEVVGCPAKLGQLISHLQHGLPKRRDLSLHVLSVLANPLRTSRQTSVKIRSERCSPGLASFSPPKKKRTCDSR